MRPRLGEQLDIREPSRLQSSLFIESFGAEESVVRQRQWRGRMKNRKGCKLKEKGGASKGEREQRRAQWRTGNSSRCTESRIFGEEPESQVLRS